MLKSPVRWLKDDKWKGLPPHEKALIHASILVGEREQGKNAGPFVTKVLGSIGLGPGFPWCAAFVSYCLKLAGHKVGPTSGRGAVRNWAQWAKESERLIHFSEARRGDLFFWLNPDKTGHIGFITAKGEGSFRTIEGNTNDAGSREGDGVYRRTRYDSPKMKYIRMS